MQAVQAVWPARDDHLSTPRVLLYVCLTRARPSDPCDAASKPTHATCATLRGWARCDVPCVHQGWRTELVESVCRAHPYKRVGDWLLALPSMQVPSKRATMSASPVASRKDMSKRLKRVSSLLAVRVPCKAMMHRERLLGSVGVHCPSGLGGCNPTFQHPAPGQRNTTSRTACLLPIPSVHHGPSGVWHR